MDKLKIIHEPSEDEPFIILYKPHNLASAPLNELDVDNALSICLKDYPQIKEVKGIKNCEYGLVHRIDNVTDGLLLIATKQSFYDHMQQLQKENKFVKTYTAKSIIQKTDETYFPFPKNYNDLQLKEGKIFEVTSYFRNYGPGNKEVRPVPLDCNSKILNKVGKLKPYSTIIKIEKIDSTDKNTFIVETTCTLTQGYRHQVRSHLAWMGLPILNDPVYNSNKSDEDIAFTAKSLQFQDEKGNNLYFSL